MSDPNKNIHIAKEASNPFVRVLWILAGTIFVVLGGLGVLLPGLPTTPFLILAAACYIRSSQRLYDWLITNKTFGPYLKDYREGKGMPKNAKILAVSMIVIFVGYAVVFALEGLMLKVFVGLFGLVGIFYIILKVPSSEDLDNESSK